MELTPTTTTKAPSQLLSAESLSSLTLFNRTEATIIEDQSPLPKLKTKTRPVEAVSGHHEKKDPHDSANDAECMPPIKVSKRHFRVFCMLFRLADEEGVPGELPWNDLP